MERVFEPPAEGIAAWSADLRRRWCSEVFANDHPITLELGCGRGDYALALARRRPDRNHVGVEIKGHRLWHGARAAEEEGLANLAFLRARVEYIDEFFSPGEVDEIWIAFSDPFPRDERGLRRITSPLFLERYRRFLAPGSTLHVKTDSEEVFRETREGALEAGLEIRVDCDDVHGGLPPEVDEELRELLEIRTHYERKWLEEGRRIRYLQIGI